MEKVALYDASIQSKVMLNRQCDENRKLRHHVILLQQKLRTKQQLLEDSLNCTFVACPCDPDGKGSNNQLIFKLRKKIMELRDLVSLQECELLALTGKAPTETTIKGTTDDSELRKTILSL